MVSLSDRYFGELEAFDEARSNQYFFDKTFVVPNSLSMESLKNNKKFIIVGRKGSGKTSVQMNMAEKLRDQGFFTHHFRFFYDLRSGDYADISRTQSEISYTSIVNNKNLFLHYDFRDIWERVFFKRIAQQLESEGKINKFVEFLEPKSSLLSNIFEGITKNLNVKLSASMGLIAGEIGFDLSDLSEKKEVSLSVFNKICRKLFQDHCVQYQMYFFVDELVFSRLDAKEDEVTLRAAMVRDVIRTVWELNSFCSQSKMDFHFICSLRPEVRNLINDLDSEAGKYLDGKDVELNWTSKTSNANLLLIEVLNRKIKYSYHIENDDNDFLTKTISFGNRRLDIDDFLLENTWGRPRDVVRFLIAIQKKCPDSERITEVEIKSALDEYSRMSLKELIDEFGVTFGHRVVNLLKNGIRKKTYGNTDEFWNALRISGLGIQKDEFIKAAFELGLIGGVLPEKGRYYWFHRGQNYLKPEHKIRIHAGLWNELSIR